MYIMMYMSELIRKQVYLEKKQGSRIKRWAMQKNVSEAEIIRTVINLGLSRLSSNGLDSVGSDSTPFFQFIESLIDQGPVSGGRTWSRDDIYDRHEQRHLSKDREDA
mgnify:CR=1 FL=1